MKLTKSGVPHVHSATIESIIEEVFVKNDNFGIKEFISSLEEENVDMCYILYSFIDSIADYHAYNDDQKEQFCALAKIACHLMYKSMEKQLEINLLEN